MYLPALIIDERSTLNGGAHDCCSECFACSPFSCWKYRTRTSAYCCLPPILICRSVIRTLCSHVYEVYNVAYRARFGIARARCFWLLVTSSTFFICGTMRFEFTDIFFCEVFFANSYFYLQYVCTYIRSTLPASPWLGRLSSCLLKSILRVQFSPSAHTRSNFFLHNKND